MTILIIRHAEKPEQGPNLSEQGQRRATALVTLFRTCFRAPDKLYAAADKPKSSRPRETLEPLGAALGLPLESSIGDSAALAKRLSDEPNDSLVLISWRHEHIPELARALGASDVPPEWPEDIYDRIWRLMRMDDGALRVADLPQALMPGDSVK
jgi:broad specificity phosphatase PhoE